MTNALTKFMNDAKFPANQEALADALSQTVSNAGGVTQTGLTFLGFSGKKGIYSLGKAKEDLDDDQLFLVEPGATIAGWTCWKDSVAISKHKWLATDAYLNPDMVVQYDELEDKGPYREGSGDGWKEMMGLGLVELAALETSIEFSSTAVSAINGLKDLIQEAADRLRKGEPEMPIIWMGREQFTAQGSTNWKPTFNVEVWVSRAAVALFAEGKMTEQELVEGKAPKKRGRRAKK